MTLGTHVHHPLAHWAHTRPHAVALASESQRLTFADLHARVQQRAAQLAAAQAPATVLLPGTGGVVHTLVEFLAVLTAGRCAAVGDPAWPAPIAQSVQAAIAALPPLVPPPAPGQEPFYIGFTSGSSGMPKGFRRHHQSWVESFRVSQHDFGEAMAGRIVAPGSLTASLFLFGALLGLWTGAGSVVQEHFSAERTLRDLASAPATVLVAVPSQLLLMLQWAQRRHCAPVAQVQLVLISGARWMREHTPALRQLFPQARTAVFSSDTAPDARSARALIQRMTDGEIDILVATQAAAKGHNFPRLTLVGVVDADLGLRGGDLRAAERTYQLLAQATGRAGRADRPGRALLQTWTPEHPVLQALAAGDRDAFVEAEMAEREIMKLPPFGRLGAIVISGPDAAALEAFAREMAKVAPNAEGVEVYGPADAPLALVRGRRRKRFLVRADRNVDLSAFLAAWRARVRPPGAIRVAIDVDPYSFL